VPLVSVVVPTYNRAHCIARAIDSALGQTHQEVEVIVLDDGSTDDTGAVIAARYGGDPRVRYAKQKNAGVSAARNAAFQMVRGDYVALLDSDDSFLPWKLELQLACFARAPGIGMVWSDLESVRPDGTVVNPRHLRRMYTAWRRFSMEEIFDSSQPLAEVAPGLGEHVGGERFWSGDAFHAMIMGSLVHTSTVLMTRERLEQVGRFNEAFKSGEDYDFHLRTCRAGRVGFADVVSIRYQTGAADQLTHQEYHVLVARNFLQTVEPMIEAERARIKLPAKMLREVIAEAHRWYAEELLLKNQAAEARPHFWKSLRLDPKVRTAGLLGMALLPEAARTGVRKVVRTVLRRQ
jgi:GT2 family glycosyltransferase